MCHWRWKSDLHTMWTGVVWAPVPLLLPNRTSKTLPPKLIAEMWALCNSLRGLCLSNSIDSFSTGCPSLLVLVLVQLRTLFAHFPYILVNLRQEQWNSPHRWHFFPCESLLLCSYQWTICFQRHGEDTLIKEYVSQDILHCITPLLFLASLTLLRSVVCKDLSDGYPTHKSNYWMTHIL